MSTNECQYAPWIEMGVSESEYWKTRYLERGTEVTALETKLTLRQAMLTEQSDHIDNLVTAHDLSAAANTALIMNNHDLREENNRLRFMLNLKLKHGRPVHEVKEKV